METTHFGQINVALGWVWMILGITTGSIIGMYAFNGPMKAPRGHEDYSSLPRRLMRLGHIAFFALPMISILYGLSIDHAPISDQMKQIGSLSFLGCMIGLPVLLCVASFKESVKFLTPIPVLSGFIGLGIICWGFLRTII